MILTYEQYLNRLAEKTYDNTRQLRRSNLQRRNGMEDLYGVMFSADGDEDAPATFYISLSPDYVYLQRFAFKFVIKPFATTIKGGSSPATVVVDNTLLSVNNNLIEPNPHTHLALPHTHNMTSGKSFIDTTSDYWRVRIGGIDITAYLIEQHNGEWIHGEGIFPNGDLVTQDGFYDILDVASMMIADGREAEADILTRPEFKKVEIISDAPFSADVYAYVKYSNLSR